MTSSRLLREPITKTQLARQSLLKDGITVGYEFSLILLTSNGTEVSSTTIHNSLTYEIPEDAIDSTTGEKPNALSCEYHQGIATKLYENIRLRAPQPRSR